MARVRLNNLHIPKCAWAHREGTSNHVLISTPVNNNGCGDRSIACGRACNGSTRKSLARPVGGLDNLAVQRHLDNNI